MSWMLTLIAAVILFAAYTAIINSEFLRCPHCGKIGSWRFDAIEEDVDECDEEGVLVRSTTRQRCRKCGGEVVQVWSDFDGREIIVPPDQWER